MFYVGDIAIKPKRLIQVTYDVMMAGTKKIKPVIRFGDINNAIQKYAEKYNYSAVRDCT